MTDKRRETKQETTPLKTTDVLPPASAWPSGQAIGDTRVDGGQRNTPVASHDTSHPLNPTPTNRDFHRKK